MKFTITTDNKHNKFVLKENDFVYSLQEARKILKKNDDWFAAAYGLDFFQFHKTNINLIDDEPHYNIIPLYKEGYWKFFWKEPGITGWYLVAKEKEITEEELINKLESLEAERLNMEMEYEQ